MQGQRVAFVAPYAELASVAAEVVQAFRLPVWVGVGDLQAGVDVVLAAVGAGGQAVISRGGTALAIREAWAGPVVEVPVSAYDVLRALHLARDKGRRVGVVGFPNVVLGARDLGPILGLEITEVSLAQESECRRAVQELARSGVQVVVGDHVAVRTAGEHGLAWVLVRSGKEAVFGACQEALRLVQVREEEQARALRFRTILEAVGDGIVVVDEVGQVTLANPAATRLLGRSEADLLGRPIGQLAPDLEPGRNADGWDQQGRLVRQGNLQAVASFFPFPLGENQSGQVVVLQELHRLQRVESRARKALLARGHVARAYLEDVVGTSPAIASTLEKARAFAALDSVVLITGETGTGKELFAQGLHNASNRRDGPFVAINCAALPETLLDSELFGYVEGAFTDARKGGKVGLFELAHMGTIFLDEIGELPLPLQGRLLRVLQEGEVMRVGDDKVVPVNVRVIAATNLDLADAVRRGRFRADLFYRIGVLHLHLPPLRERPEDIGPLAGALLMRLAAKHRRAVPDLSPGALALLQHCPWPGNVRELRNVLERLVARVTGHAAITPDDLAAVGLQAGPASLPAAPVSLARDQILGALAQARQNRALAARLLGVSRSTLWRRMRELALL